MIASLLGIALSREIKAVSLTSSTSAALKPAFLLHCPIRQERNITSSSRTRWERRCSYTEMVSGIQRVSSLLGSAMNWLYGLASSTATTTYHSQRLSYIFATAQSMSILALDLAVFYWAEEVRVILLVSIMIRVEPFLPERLSHCLWLVHLMRKARSIKGSFDLSAIAPRCALETFGYVRGWPVARRQRFGTIALAMTQ